MHNIRHDSATDQIWNRYGGAGACLHAAVCARCEAGNQLWKTVTVHSQRIEKAAEI